MVSTTEKIKDALLGKSHGASTTTDSNTSTSHSTGHSTAGQAVHAAAAHATHPTAHSSTTGDYNDVTGARSVAATRAADAVTSDAGARSMAGVPHQSTVAAGPTATGQAVAGSNVAVSAPIQSAAAGTSWRHESHVLTNTMTGLQATPNIPNVNVTELYKDYLPHRNNMWIQTLIQKMDSASIDIDKYAKAQQELVSREAAAEVEKIMQNNKLKQDTLIASMHKRANEFEVEYSRKREAMIRQLDKEESVLLERLQAQLKTEQEQIALETKAEVERIAQLARDRKMAILGEAQAKQDQLSQTVTTTTTQEVDPSSLTKHHLYGHDKTTGLGTSDVRSEHTGLTTGEPRMSKNITTTTTKTGSS